MLYGLCAPHGKELKTASIIIPALLRALGVGDLLMRENIVDLNLGTIEIAPMSLMRTELGLPKPAARQSRIAKVRYSG